MSIYYVYAYLRSKDSTIAPKGTPYYIGKGSIMGEPIIKTMVLYQFLKISPILSS